MTGVLESPTMERPQTTDEALAASAQRGDRAAFSALMERYRRLAFAYSAARLGSREEAEDALQECFVRAYLSLGRFRGSGSWGAWFMTIVRNQCTDVERRRRIRVTDPLDETTVDRTAGPEGHCLERHEREALKRAIGTLPENLRVPLLMRYELDRSYREIALALGIPESTLVGRLATALRTLRRKMGVEAVR
jgi:RNA polymerase sigma factor (sigma-70 family)